LVRKLKAEKAAKDILQPEINKLLELKTELTTLQAKLTTEAVELSTATTTGTAVASVSFSLSILWRKIIGFYVKCYDLHRLKR